MYNRILQTSRPTLGDIGSDGTCALFWPLARARARSFLRFSVSHEGVRTMWAGWVMLFFRTVCRLSDTIGTPNLSPGDRGRARRKQHNKTYNIFLSPGCTEEENINRHYVIIIIIIIVTCVPACAPQLYARVPRNPQTFLEQHNKLTLVGIFFVVSKHSLSHNRVYACVVCLCVYVIEPFRRG
jgi:hypothetical protein